MSDQNNHSPTAATYAQALLDLANERNAAESVSAELSALAEVLDANPTFRLYLADPAIGAIERRQTLERIFRGRASDLLLHFIGVVNEHGRLKLIGQMIDAYDELLQAQLGKVEVDIYLAHRLSPDELKMVQQRVSAALRKDAVIHQYVNESIIGGMILRVGDKLIDASARSQLEGLRHKLIHAELPVN